MIVRDPTSILIVNTVIYERTTTVKHNAAILTLEF